MFFTACVAIWISSAAAVQEPSRTPRETPDSAELSRLENVWNDAHVRGDVDALDRLWDDDLVVTVPGMAVMTKPQTIGIWQSGRMKFQRYEASDLRIRVYGDAAVVIGRLQRTRTVEGRSFDDDWRFTKTYVRRPGGWRVVALHMSPAAPR